MVFDDLWISLRRRVEPERAGFRDCDIGNGFKARTDVARRRAAAFSRFGKIIAGVGDALGLFCVLAILDHLVGKFAGRDSLVSAANPWQLGRDRVGGDCAALRVAVPVLTFAIAEAQSASAGPGGGDDPADALCGSDLAR